MFLYSAWRGISLSTRQTIAAAFDIKKSLPTHVVNNVVEQDGYQIAEIESKLTPATMAAYLNVPVKTDPAEMWTMLVDKAEGRESVTKTPVPEPTPEEIDHAISAAIAPVPETADIMVEQEPAKNVDPAVIPPVTPTPAKRGRKSRAK